MAELLTMRRAVEIFGLDCDTSRRIVNIECPCCGKGPKDKKLNINFDRYGNDDGAFRCVRCGAEGRPLQFWALVRGLDMKDMQAAAKDYFAYAEENNLRMTPVKKVFHTRIDVDTADVATRNATYNGLLNILALNDYHRQALLNRGLSEKVIEQNMYRSYPAASLSDIAELLSSQGYVLKGVPGFFTKEGNWSMLRFSGGFLIPQRDGFGRIQGMQIRMDNPTKGKYITLSTGEYYQNGAKGHSCCHLAKGKDIKKVILTEGPLKADIISYYTGMSVIGIPGVNALSYLKKALHDMKAAGMEQILTAFDMDLYDNLYVMRAFEHLKEVLQALRIPYSQLVWDRRYKGLDDFLHAEKK